MPQRLHEAADQSEKLQNELLMSQTSFTVHESNLLGEDTTTTIGVDSTPVGLDSKLVESLRKQLSSLSQNLEHARNELKQREVDLQVTQYPTNPTYPTTIHHSPNWSSLESLNLQPN